MVHHVAPGFDVEGEVCDIGWGGDVLALVVDGVHAAEDEVVDVGHFDGHFEDVGIFALGVVRMGTLGGRV